MKYYSDDVDPIVNEMLATPDLNKSSDHGRHILEARRLALSGDVELFYGGHGVVTEGCGTYNVVSGECDCEKDCPKSCAHAFAVLICHRIAQERESFDKESFDGVCSDL